MFEDLLGLASTISSSHNTEPDDVIKTKNALAQTGHYEVPSFGITPYPDSPMIDGMKSFQKDNGLKIDGVMRPGGPTETALGKKTGSNSSVDLYASAPKKPKQPKPQPPKIDPLTGLAEIKMPKVAKPKANPWFKSAKVKPLTDEDHSSNTRAMNGMLQYSKNGSLPGLYANTMKGGDDKAINEFANLLQQLGDRKPERVDGLEREVMAKLPSGVQAKIQNMDVDEEEPKPVQVAAIQKNAPKPSMTHERVMELQRQFQENPEKFIRAKQPNVNQTGGDVQVAFAPLLAFIPWLALGMGVSAMIAQQTYNGWSVSKQQDARDDYDDYKDGERDDTDYGDEDNFDNCRDRWELERYECDTVKRVYGQRKGRECQEVAADRLDLCKNEGYPNPSYPPRYDPNRNYD